MIKVHTPGSYRFFYHDPAPHNFFYFSVNMTKGKKRSSTSTQTSSSVEQTQLKLAKMNVNDEEAEGQRGFSIQQSFCLLMLARSLNDSTISQVSYEVTEDVSYIQSGIEYRVQVKSKRDPAPVSLVEPVRKLMKKFVKDDGNSHYQLALSNATTRQRKKKRFLMMF